ncbi:MAG: hypothetical protein QOK28_2517 [Actinomycetota bacterium]
MFDHEQIVMTPAFEHQPRAWARDQARAAVRQAPLFKGTSPRVWFGNYEGAPAWLAITDGLTLAPSMGAPTRGYQVAAFADGELPARALSGVAQTGGEAPKPNAAPKRHRYNGRLHVSFVIPSGGPVGGSLAEWMMQPAIGVHPKLTLTEAKRRSRLPSGRVYFGLFTGLDDTGTMHNRTPAWMDFGTGYMSRLSNGPCCNRTPETFAHPVSTFGASVISDTPTNAWESGTFSGGGHPLVD